MLVVGETAFVLVAVLVPGFFFLILIPGTGAEFRASRNPVHSIAAARPKESSEHRMCYTKIQFQNLLVCTYVVPELS